ncbi:16S rRNA (uracil(1498)-N(3))-methyltransferase [Frigoribacterium sp. RIT-PI-h]|uniref:16S rRNA (uracil(1498)-N(3))-methyltransferase n=1 Tax=Frigoribacterium sp. RIT-PI-h TaxID=1690245 RepID=UPI0009E72BEB
MAHFYLVDDLVAADVGGTVELTGSEARHAVTVSRVRVGEALTLGNGRGLVVQGEVTEAAPERLVLLSTRVVRHEPPTTRLVLAQALAKGDRDELAVQAATELGVDEIVPWAAARSISRWEGPKVAKGLTRWSTIVREATKQSIRPWAPEVSGLATTRLLAERASRDLALALEPAAEPAPTAVDLTAGGGVPARVVVVVGPEGGGSPARLQQLAAAGAPPARPRDAAPRTPSAGPAALPVLGARLGRRGPRPPRGPCRRSSLRWAACPRPPTSPPSSAAPPRARSPPTSCSRATR